MFHLHFILYIAYLFFILFLHFYFCFVRYSLPQDLSEHVSHIFNTVELPPVLTFNDGKVQIREKKTYDTKNSQNNHDNKDSKIDQMEHIK